MTVKDFLSNHKDLREFYILYFNKDLELQCDTYEKLSDIPRKHKEKEILDIEFNEEERWVELWV